MQGSVANMPTVSVCLLCLCSYDSCSEFVHTRLAVHYLSKASPHSADQLYILLIYEHSPLVTLPGNFPFFAVYKTLWSCSLGLSLVHYLMCARTEVCDCLCSSLLPVLTCPRLGHYPYR